MNKIISALVLMLAVGSTVSAQQDAQYTQYMYNTQVINPAYAGSRGVFSSALMYRSQWTGFDGAPTTQTLNINTPVSKNVGLGLSIVNDEIGNGVNENTYFNADFSYALDMSTKLQTRKLSFGLKAGGHLLNVNLNKLRNFDTNLITTDNTVVDKKFAPNLGAGIYYHTDTFFVGFSAPNFFATEHFESSKGSNTFLVKNKIQYYLISGLVMKLNYMLQFKPTVLIKSAEGSPMQVDLSANFLANNKFSFGAGYRVNGALSGLVGYQASDKVMLGLAYDREISDLGGVIFNDGSFEFFLRFELLTRYKRIVKPRFF